MIKSLSESLSVLDVATALRRRVRSGPDTAAERRGYISKAFQISAKINEMLVNDLKRANGVRSGSMANGLDAGTQRAIFRQPESSFGLRRCRRCGGVALVMVLAALFLLSLVVFGLAQRVGDEMFLERHDSRTLDARALAFTGLEIALHPLAGVKTPAMKHQLDKTHRYEARLVGEGGKINLNWLLTGEDPRKLQVLQDYLRDKGIGFQEREALLDCLLDWIEPGDTHHLNGTKVAVDGSPVPGRPFQDLAEIKRVVGNKPMTDVAGWENDFTLLSKGPVDLQWAEEAVVAALPGVGESRARSFVKMRRGPDGLDGTADDMVIAKLNNPQAVPQLLGLSQDAYQAMSDLISVGGDSTVRIVSAGQAVDVIRTFEVVARKEGVQPQILSWKEY